MSMKMTTRSFVVFSFLAVSAVVLLCSAVFAWRQWRGYSAGRKALSARSESDRSLDSIRSQMAETGDRKAVLVSQTGENAAALEALEKKLMPLEAAASRLLKLEMLDMAAKCGLIVEEMRPVRLDGRYRDPEGTVDGGAAPGAAAGEANAIAFLGKFPAGEVYRRPLVALQCRAKYGQIRGFFAEMKGLRWHVTPVAFSIGRPGAAMPAPLPTSADSEASDSGTPVRWVADDNLLHLTVVLAM